MVLLAANAMPNTQIANTVGVSRPTVISWQDRYQASGIPPGTTSPGLDAREINEIKVVVATLANDDRPPGRLRDYPLVGRFPTAELGISFASVARIWLNWHIRPHRIEPAGRQRLHWPP